MDWKRRRVLEREKIRANDGRKKDTQKRDTQKEIKS